jgi:hypothetical protein
MPSHRRKGEWINWKEGYVGAPPSSTQFGQKAQRVWSWLSQWRHGEYVASYSGRPEMAINGNGSNDFHIILFSPEKADTGNVTRQLGCYIKLWDHSFAGVGALDADWHDPFGAAGTAVWDLTAWPVTTNDTYGDAPQGPEAFLYEGMTYTPTVATDFCRHSKLVINNAMVACMSIFEMPEPDLTAANLQVKLGDVGVGEVIRGFDTTLGNSLGALIELGGDCDDGDESLERNTRRTLFQTCYPVGVYQANTGGWESHRADSNGVAFRYRIQTRNLRGLAAGTATTFPAFVITADAGVDVRYVAGSGDIWSYTVPGGGVTDQLVTYSDGAGVAGAGLEVDNDAIDYVDIQVDAGVAEESQLQTVALFEDGEW